MPSLPRQLTLGVLGHVDHGKTSLVRALTGTDTDRLKEEKARGMSIVPGFAHLAFETGTVDLIDAPGHEDYVRAMIAGASGIDAALLVVDAREGVRRQTVEHLAIAELLGVRRGVVALSKIDLLEKGHRDSAAAALRAHLAKSFLRDAPVVGVSPMTGEGLDDVRAALRALLERGEPVCASAGGFLPIDRVFSLVGHGTVVTGTLRRGALARGDELEILPQGIRTAVRQLQVHGRSAERALPGQRVGLNLRGVKPERIARGSVVAPPGLMAASTLLDVELKWLDGFAPRPGQRLRALLGTSESLVRLRLAPPPAAFAQLRCERALCALPDERFILRDDGARCTVGGGRVLAPQARRMPTSAAPWRERLERLASGLLEDRLLEALRAAREGVVSLEALAARQGVAPGAIAEALARTGRALIEDDRVFFAPHLQEAERALLAFLDAFHERHPAREGASVAACRDALPPRARAALFDAALARLQAAHRLEVKAGCVRRAGFDPMQALSQAERECAEALEHAFKAGGLAPPALSDMVGGDPRREAVYRLLLARGRLIRIGRPGALPVVFHREALERARRVLGRVYPPPAGFTVSQARELLGSTRKFVVPLLEFLDASRFTRRDGDVRVLLRAEDDSRAAERPA